MSRITDYTRAHPVGFTLSIIGTVIVTLFVIISVNTIMFAGKVKIVITTAPSDIVVKLDGKEIKDRTLYLEPRKYTFSGSKEGYETHTKDFYLEEGQGDTAVALSLIAQNEQTRKESRDNQADYLKNEGIAGKQKNADGKRFREKNTIVSKLPYKTLLYTIGYRADKSDPSGMSIIIEIDAAEGLRRDVVAQIERWGYDPTEMNINFRGYENPFDEKKDTDHTGDTHSHNHG